MYLVNQFVRSTLVIKTYCKYGTILFTLVYMCLANMDLFCLLGKSFNGMDSHHDYYPMGKGPPTLTLIYGRKLGSYPHLDILFYLAY